MQTLVTSGSSTDSNLSHSHKNRESPVYATTVDVCSKKILVAIFGGLELRRGKGIMQSIKKSLFKQLKLSLHIPWIKHSSKASSSLYQTVPVLSHLSSYAHFIKRYHHRYHN